MVMRTAMLAQGGGSIPAGAPMPFTRKEMIPTFTSAVVVETVKNFMYSWWAVPVLLNTRNLFQKKECVTTIANVITEKIVISMPRVMPEIHMKKLKMPKLKIVFNKPTSPYRTNFQPRILCRSGSIREILQGAVRM